jgi:hypothetical protein
VHRRCFLPGRRILRGPLNSMSVSQWASPACHCTQSVAAARCAIGTAMSPNTIWPVGQRGNPHRCGGQIAGKGMVNRGEKAKLKGPDQTSILHPPNIGTWAALSYTKQHLWAAILPHLDIIRSWPRLLEASTKRHQHARWEQ